MTTDCFAIGAANGLEIVKIVALVDEIPGHRDDVLGARVTAGEHGNDILQSLT